MHTPHQIVLLKGEPKEEQPQGELQHVRRSALHRGVEPSR